MPSRLSGHVRTRSRSATGRWAAAGLLAVVLEAGAGQATGSFSVTATVSSSCSVSASNLSFGNYDPASASDTVASSTISVTCSLLTPYTISLNDGTFASGGTRQMGSGASRLSYQLYRDVGLTGVFGLASSLLGVSGIGTGAAAATVVYGKIPKNQTVAPGSYSDEITVTVDY